MRKETSAGVIAGAISGAPAGFIFSVFVVVMGFSGFESGTNRIPNLAPNSRVMLLIVVVVFMFVMFVALTSFLGGIAGFIFVKLVNSLPFRSTYVKALVPWGVLLILYSVLVPLIYRMSLNGAICYVARELPAMVLILAAAVLFAYLFNRWANHQTTPHKLAAENPEISPPST